MKKKVKISSTSLPTRSPVGFAILYWLLLEHLHAPEWAYGVLWTLVAILGLLFLVSQFTETTRDVPGFGEESR